MDNEQKTPSAECLRQMPYSELKKIAKQRGIKGNLKAEKLIAALTSMDSDDMDSFSTPAAKIMNSSRKKKLEKFDEDSMTPLVTPRRGTYSVGSPIALKQNETTPSSVACEPKDTSKVILGTESEKKLHNCQQNDISPSPLNHELSVLNVSNVTVGRGSERKSRSRKQIETPSSLANESFVLDISNVTANVANESSVLDMSNVTVGRGSERKLRSRKVSFLSPVMTPRTPRNSNIKMRPKTPIVSRTSLAASIPCPEMKEFKVYLGERVDISSNLTPLPEKIPDETDTKSTSFLTSNKVSAKKKTISTPKLTKSFLNEDESFKKKRAATPKLTRSFLNEDESFKKKRAATPNFKKIHEKAFEKMESIEDYQKRVVNSAKKMGVFKFKANKVTKATSKIPAFGGIPFIPSVSKSVTTKWNTSLNKNKQVEEKKKQSKKNSENIRTRNKSKFDLKASLSRKLGYKPYTGPLKPLTPSNVLNTSSATCDHKSKFTPAKGHVDKTVTSNRLKNRSMIKGVRTNKRFELQMKNRMIID